MRPTKILCSALFGLLLALPAGAQYSRADFHEYASPTTVEHQAAIGAPVTSGGFDFYYAPEFSPGSNNTLATWGTDEAVANINIPSNIGSSTALYGPLLAPNAAGGEIDIFAAGGDPFFVSTLRTFGLASIDVAHLYSSEYLAGTGLSQSAFTLTIFGANSRNQSFFQSFTIPLPPAMNNGTPFLTTLELNSRFSDVNNVWFNQGTGSGRTFQFTNVTPTPEPASLVLLGTGLVGIFAVTARRRRGKSLPVA
jgi:hypothetical protein